MILNGEKHPTPEVAHESLGGLMYGVSKKSTGNACESLSNLMGQGNTPKVVQPKYPTLLGKLMYDGNK